MTDYQPESSFEPQETSTWAIVSLIAGVVSFLFAPFIGSVVAIFTGYAAKKEIRNGDGRISGDGLATAGLVLGWINVALSLMACVLAVLVFAGVIGGIALCGPLAGLSESGLLH